MRRYLCRPKGESHSGGSTNVAGYEVEAHAMPFCIFMQRPSYSACRGGLTVENFSPRYKLQYVGPSPSARIVHAISNMHSETFAQSQQPIHGRPRLRTAGLAWESQRLVDARPGSVPSTDVPAAAQP
jgi:hypothetical protein